MLNLIILLKNLISDTYVLTESDVSELYAVSESVIDEVFSNKEFPKEEFVKSVLKRFRLVNTNSTSGKNLKFDEARMGEQVALSCLVNALGEHVLLAEDELLLYLDSDVQWLVSLAFSFLNQLTSPPLTTKIDTIFREMSKCGVNEYPYTTGESLKWYLEKDSYLYERVLKEYETGTDNFKYGILQTFSMIDKLPLVAENLIINQFEDESLYGMAVIAACRCVKRRSDAIKLLYNALSDDKFSVRGNAAVSLAMLKASNSEILSRMEELLGDTEGYDWSVQDKIIEALGMFGALARTSVPALLNLLSEELKCDNEECNGYPVVKQYICWALGEIGDDSSEVIDLLVEVVKQGGWISAPEAIKTLNRFGFDDIFK